MGLKRIKISELTLSDNLKGLYTIGVKLINGGSNERQGQLGTHSDRL